MTAETDRRPSNRDARDRSVHNGIKGVAQLEYFLGSWLFRDKYGWTHFRTKGVPLADLVMDIRGH
jgi:hypothetical protein